MKSELSTVFLFASWACPRPREGGPIPTTEWKLRCDIDRSPLASDCCGKAPLRLAHSENLTPIHPVQQRAERAAQVGVICG